MADVDHPKTHVEDQDVDLPRKQPESPKREGIDPLTESDTMYPRENTKDVAEKFNKKEEKTAVADREADEAKVAETVSDQQEVNAQANTPNDLLPKNDDENKTPEDVNADRSDENSRGAADPESSEPADSDVKEAVEKDNEDIEDGDLEDKETGTQNTSPSNKTTDETLQDEVKTAEKKTSTKTPKR